MLEGVELVSKLVAQYAKVEEVYFYDVSAQQDRLEKSITELYVAILTYLSKATQYYDEGRAVSYFKTVYLRLSLIRWTRSNGKKLCAWLVECG